MQDIEKIKNGCNYHGIIKNFEGYAQCWKLALEAQQRFDRGLRKEWKDKREKGK